MVLMAGGGTGGLFCGRVPERPAVAAHDDDAGPVHQARRRTGSEGQGEQHLRSDAVRPGRRAPPGGQAPRRRAPSRATTRSAIGHPGGAITPSARHRRLRTLSLGCGVDDGGGGCDDPRGDSVADAHRWQMEGPSLLGTKAGAPGDLACRRPIRTAPPGIVPPSRWQRFQHPLPTPYCTILRRTGGEGGGTFRRGATPSSRREGRSSSRLHDGRLRTRAGGTAPCARR
jgi:hypothetical protein